MLDRQIRAAVGGRFDSGMSSRVDLVVDRRGRLLHCGTLVGDRVLEAVKIAVPETLHAAGVRVDEAAECAIEPFLTR